MYGGFQCKLHVGTGFFNSASHLSMLRISAKAKITFQEDSFDSLKHLQVLNLTRTKDLSLRSYIVSIKSLKQNPLETLILKNAQSVNTNDQDSYLPNVDISKIICPLSETLKTLDLSHNDILTITMTPTINCVYRFHSLDLRYNIIAHFLADEHTEVTSPLTLMLFGVEIFYLDHMWDNRDADEHLWHDRQQQEQGQGLLRPGNILDYVLPAGLKS